MEFLGKVAFVTGASGGIGSAICRGLADAGADIALCYHSNEDAANNLLRDIQAKGRRASVIKVDVSKRKSVFDAVSIATNQLGQVDILVNNAGITMKGKIEDISEAMWDRCMAINLKSALFTTQAVLPSMKKKMTGTIINISSVGAKIGGINSASCYSVSKAGLSCLTIQTAKETLSYGINVNAVAPGIIDTPLQDLYGRINKNNSFKSVVRGPGKPEDIANVVVFLASPSARYITGEILDVNGGIHMD